MDKARAGGTARGKAMAFPFRRLNAQSRLEVFLSVAGPWVPDATNVSA